MQFRFRCAAVLTAVLLCSAAALPALAEETATPETADSVASASTYTGWKTVNGKDYWYENGVKQGTTGRGKEIYDPDSDAWYWLDANQGGAKAVNKDVYQESNGGKWVRYDANGHMIKGWDTNDDGTYYFDLVTGAMAKGDIVVDNLPCSFDTVTGIGLNCAWKRINDKDYWYEGGKRQGYDPNNAAYRGKEIYDPASNGISISVPFATSTPSMNHTTSVLWDGVTVSVILKLASRLILATTGSSPFTRSGKEGSRICGSSLGEATENGSSLLQPEKAIIHIGSRYVEILYLSLIHI